MSARSGRRNNILAGIFLIGSLMVAVALSFMLSGIAEQFGSYQRYVLWFPLSVGAPGIKSGSPVNLGGQPVGRVEKVRRDLDNPEGPRILLEVAVAADLVLYPDARAYLEQPLLGTLSAINIRALGTEDAGPPLAPGALLKGGVAPPSFLESAGFGPDQQEQVQSIISRVEQIVDQFYATLEETDAAIQPILERADVISADVQTIVSDVADSMEQWTGDVDATLANIRAGSERVGPFLDETDAAVADTRALLASGQSAIDDNRPSIDRIVGNVEETTRRVNEETVPLINQTIEEYRAPSADFAAALSDLRLLLAEEVPNIRRTIANMRLAADQMKLLMGEIRAAPWRLLERPTTREMEAQLFYDATRAYAEAVSDLRAASEALAAAQATGSANATELQGLFDHLQQAFENYSQAEARMLEQIPPPEP